jgi:hypothetical protein
LGGEFHGVIQAKKDNLQKKGKKLKKKLLKALFVGGG